MKMARSRSTPIYAELYIGSELSRHLEDDALQFKAAISGDPGEEAGGEEEEDEEEEESSLEKADG